MSGTIANKVDVSTLNKATTENVQECAAIAGPHSSMPCFLPLVCTGCLEDNTDMTNIKKNLNIAKQNILLYVVSF
jgi:hypothetical protein